MILPSLGQDLHIYILEPFIIFIAVIKIDLTIVVISTILSSFLTNIKVMYYLNQQDYTGIEPYNKQYVYGYL